MNTAPLIEVDGLEVRFEIPEGTVHAVNGVTFSVARGETLAVVGESGSGKTVTMLALLRLLAEPPARIAGGTATLETARGTVELLEESQRRLRRVRGAEIGFIAQDPMTSLNPTVKISTQLIDVIRTHLGLSRRQARARAIDLLKRVGIPDAENRVDAYPHEFSGGMRQRVMIAIAVACNPQLVIADEPTTALDVTVQAQIAELMNDLRDELGMALIWITHDLGVVAGLADRVAVMYAGQLVEITDVAALYERPLHPYTIGLLNALPKMGDRASRLTSIPGVPPDLAEAPTYCSFAARCPHVFDRCLSEVPPLIEPVPGHHVACFYDVEAAGPRND